MLKIANAPENERKVLFLNTAEKLRMHPAIVEQDFWVCFMLDHLFNKSEFSKLFVFKGGTSLSKAYHSIERFSEDIDLILDWRVLDYGEKEPYLNRSKTQQDKFNKAMNSQAACFYKEQLVQRELNYAIVDEIDSILIDEARTPLIISGRGKQSSDLYKKADKFVRKLIPKIIVEENAKDFVQAEDNENYDYIVDLKAKSASLTQKGIKKAEEEFNLENFNDIENSEIVHNVNQALRAHGVMKKDIDYIVKDIIMVYIKLLKQKKMLK